MLFEDDIDPKTRQPRPRLLDSLSVPELKAYLTALEAEKTRVEAEIRRKDTLKSAADSFFKT